ncbi:hypothetical protein J3E69DRAFT_330377 [Trichoderma sp. SZMC 28015]
MNSAIPQTINGIECNNTLFRIIWTHPPNSAKALVSVWMGGGEKSASAEPERTMAFPLLFFLFVSPKCVHACTYRQTDRRSSAGACVIACAKMVMEACASFWVGLFGHSYCTSTCMHQTFESAYE